MKAGKSSITEAAVRQGIREHCYNTVIVETQGAALSLEAVDQSPGDSGDCCICQTSAPKEETGETGFQNKTVYKFRHF